MQIRIRTKNVKMSTVVNKFPFYIFFKPFGNLHIVHV